MTIKRSVSVFALPLALAIAASPASADQAKTLAKPAGTAPLKVDSPNMVASISDWHAELAAAPQRTAQASAIGCTCGKTNTQAAANTQATPNTQPAAPMQTRTTTQTTATKGQVSQRPPQFSVSGKPAQRAQEIPLSSVKR